MSVLPVLAQTSSRLLFVDLLRGLAAQVIVWHHLAFYGPLSDTAYPLARRLIDFLYEYGRFAVQIFFVVGGFLAAQSLAKAGALNLRSVAKVAIGRYRRIGLPYLASLVIAIAANSLADRWMDHDSISSVPGLPSILAHMVFLQDILGFENITAGIWYIAIEFQLVVLVFAITAASQVIASRFGSSMRIGADGLAQCVFWALAIAALFAINRDSDFDMWAPYFFGSYFVGMLLQRTLARRASVAAFASYLALLAAAVTIEFRPRLLVASAVALLLFGAARLGVLATWPDNRVTQYLSRTSYSLYLIHFPVCLVVNAFVWHHTIAPLAAVGGMVLAFALSHLAAAAFYRFVEAPCLPAAVDAKSLPVAVKP